MARRTTELAEYTSQTTQLQESDQLLNEDQEEDNQVEGELDQRGFFDHPESPRILPASRVQRDGSRPGSSRKGQINADRELTVDQPTISHRLARRLSMSFADLNSPSGR